MVIVLASERNKPTKLILLKHQHFASLMNRQIVILVIEYVLNWNNQPDPGRLTEAYQISRAPGLSELHIYPYVYPRNYCMMRFNRKQQSGHSSCF